MELFVLYQSCFIVTQVDLPKRYRTSASDVIDLVITHTYLSPMLCNPSQHAVGTYILYIPTFYTS